MAASPPPLASPTNQRNRLAMYEQNLSERPRILKHALIGTACSAPDENRFNIDYRKKRLSSGRNSRPQVVSKLSCAADRKLINNLDDDYLQRLKLQLEDEFMNRLIIIEDAPEEVKFPVLRASHPGGRVFRTQQLGFVNKQNTNQRHPFNLENPNAPVPKYSCYYDKHLRNFFQKPGIRKKLIEQGIVTDDFYIREPYKAFKEYMRVKKLPFGSNPITPSETVTLSSCSETKKNKTGEFSDASVKKYLAQKFNVQAGLVDEIFSGRRKGSVIPLTDNGKTKEAKEEEAKEHKKVCTSATLRCNTPQLLTTREKELHDALHNSRINVVLSRRQLLALEKKSNVIEQRILKDRKLTDNKKQMELGRWEDRLEKMVTTFDRKKRSIFKRLSDIEADKRRRQEEKDIEVDKLKKKFAAMFINHSIKERSAKRTRQELEKEGRHRNELWMLKQKEERNRKLQEISEKTRATQVSGVAKVSTEKAARIAKLQLKLETCESNLEGINREKKAMRERLGMLQRDYKKINNNL